MTVTDQTRPMSASIHSVPDPRSRDHRSATVIHLLGLGPSRSTRPDPSRSGRPLAADRASQWRGARRSHADGAVAGDPITVPLESAHSGPSRSFRPARTCPTWAGPRSAPSHLGPSRSDPRYSDSPRRTHPARPAPAGAAWLGSVLRPDGLRRVGSSAPVGSMSPGGLSATGGVVTRGSVAATASARNTNAGNRVLIGGRSVACTATRVVSESRTRSTLDPCGAARRTAARTATTGSPRAAALAPALAASTHATWAAAALTPHRATAMTTTKAGKATAISTVTEPRSPRRSHNGTGRHDRAWFGGRARFGYRDRDNGPGPGFGVDAGG